MNLVDRTFSHIAGPVAWNVHAEWVVESRTDLERLRVAARATVGEHPLLRARRGSQDTWVVRDGALPTVAHASVDDEAGLSRLRNEIVSRRFDLDCDLPVRFAVVAARDGDHVLAVADHALVDGVGIGRTMVSLMAHYDSDWNGVADERWRDAHALVFARPPESRIRQTVQMLRARAVPTAVRLAPEHASDEPGYGVVYHELSPDSFAATQAMLPDGRASANDVMVAAFVLAGMEWNCARGAASAPLSVGVPLNLRPARSWLEGVCNATLPWPVRVDDVGEPAEVLAQVIDQLRPVRTGIYSLDVRAVMGYLASLQALPLRVRHGLATSTVVSTVPAAGASSARLYGGAPASSAMAMTFAVIPAPGACRLSARFVLARHSAAGAASYLTAVDNAVQRLVEAIG